MSEISLPMTREDARKAVQAYVNRPSQEKTFGDMVVMDQLTIDKPYGWIFFYDTEQFSKTGERRYALIGNSPILVEKSTGTLHFLGTFAPEHAIRDWEQGLWRESYLKHVRRLNGADRSEQA